MVRSHTPDPARVPSSALHLHKHDTLDKAVLTNPYFSFATELRCANQTGNAIKPLPLQGEPFRATVGGPTMP